jgi:pyruvate dehydrogenase E2 component (dihydrolipoamide acetyltransferase)
MYEFTMPSLGADMEEGTFVEWNVKPGQVVAKGAVVCVVETQKGAVDVEIWESGTIAKLVAEPGQKIPVNQVMALVATEGEDWKSVAATAVTEAPATEPVAPSAQPAEIAPAPARPAAPGRVKASPAARKRAEELGIDLATVQPAGADGVISIADVERVRAAPSTTAGATDRQAGMRAAIASAMSRSKREIPHFYLGNEINVEKAATWLEQRNATVAISERVLFAALELKAVALALGRTPELNGFYVDGAFRAGSGIHLGVAISLREGGLVAPALRNADKLSLVDLMGKLKDLLKRARGDALRSSEMSDPTITVTNLGELGVDTVYGVIQPPQVALVGFGKVVQRPCVVDGRVAIARVVHATLSADHRVSDGMRGARFLTELDRLFQEPESLA